MADGGIQPEGILPDAANPRVLRDALGKTVDALSGGLWDYGPGQDEHEKCNEVIDAARAALTKEATNG